MPRLSISLDIASNPLSFLYGTTAIYVASGLLPELILDFRREFYKTNAGIKTFPSAITHTRASTATYVDSNGILQTAAINEPRVGHHVWNGTAWVNEGLLHESEARTNLLTHSEDLSNAFWGKYKVTVSGNTIIPNTENDFHEVFVSTISVTSGATYVLSFEVESAGYDWFQIVLSTALTGNGNFQNFNLSNNTVGSGNTTLTRSITDMGNGVSKVSLQILANATGISFFSLASRPNDGARREAFVGNGVSGATINRIQFELGPTPSSYIPTAGTTVTRSADVLTIPAANLPYPEPVVIGPELVTNGTFDSDISGWIDNSSAGGSIAWNAAGYVDVINATGNARLAQNLNMTQGNVYELTVQNVGGGTVTVVNAQRESPFGSVTLGNVTAGQTASFVFVDQYAVSGIQFSSFGAGTTVSLDNISVREINPLAVSIQMDGRVTYADTGFSVTVNPFMWGTAGLLEIDLRIGTSGAAVGEVAAAQYFPSGVGSFSAINPAYNPDVNVPINMAARFTSNLLQVAADGTLDATPAAPTGLPDLSAAELRLGRIYNGTIRTFRMWGQDIGDAGLVEATKPSLVPSLSLTFDGTENSFIVEDWSE